MCALEELSKGDMVDMTYRNIVIVSSVMKQAVAVVQEFIRSKEYKVYDMCHHVGFWRSLLVRHSERNNQLMIVVIVGNPYEQSLPNANEALKQMSEEVRQEIDSVMKELANVCVEKIPSLASFSYQMYVTCYCCYLVSPDYQILVLIVLSLLFMVWLLTDYDS